MQEVTQSRRSSPFSLNIRGVVRAMPVLCSRSGTDCGEGQGFCNYGSCQTRQGQCTSLWGEGVDVNDKVCYDRYNRKGEWYGNCGSLGAKKYIACLDRLVNPVVFLMIGND